MLKDYPLVYIEYQDSLSDANSWTDLESAIHWADDDDWLIIQVGFILKETDEYLLMCPSTNPQNSLSAPKVAGVWKVPKKAITKRVDFTLPS